MKPLTVAQARAVKWLEERGGHGTLDRYGRLVAASETATSIDPTTWLRLVALGRIAGRDGRLYLVDYETGEVLGDAGKGLSGRTPETHGRGLRS